MSPLQKIELKILQLLPSLNLRPTLDRSAELGELLVEAKSVLPHGQWGPWLHRVRLNDRTARTHMEVFRESGNRRTDSDMTIKQFIAYLRQSRINGKKAEREVSRAECAARLGKLPDSIRLIHSDNRVFNWPQANAIVTDPPWACMASYRWLASMAAERLVDGGLLLLQCGTAYMAEVMRICEDAGLRYNWCLSFGFAETRRAKPTAGRWLCGWNPVLVLSKGDLRLVDVVADFYLVSHSRDAKDLHDWASPIKPFRYWMKVMIPPGSLVLDPFAGSGTTGVVCRELGMRWIGTEIDRGSFEVARGRLSEAVEVKAEPLRV